MKKTSGLVTGKENKSEPSTQAWPFGTVTSASGHGGKVFTLSPSRATILLTRSCFGSIGDLAMSQISSRGRSKIYFRAMMSPLFHRPREPMLNRSKNTQSLHRDQSGLSVGYSRIFIILSVAYECVTDLHTSASD